jgi:hypothetical protein
VPTPKGRGDNHVISNPRHQSNVPSRVSSAQTWSAGSATSIVSTKREGAEAKNASSTAGSMARNYQPSGSPGSELNESDSMSSTRSSTDPKERKVMDPQQITEKPQDRTGSWVRRHDEYTPRELAGGRS